MLCKGHFHWFFRLNPCQVLLPFRAVQVKQLAFLASFLSDLFRSFATLSCRVLIVQRFQECGKGGNNQWFHCGQTHVGSPIFLHSYIFEFSMPGNQACDPKFPNPKQHQHILFVSIHCFFFPLPCLMIGGYFHLDFSVTTLWFYDYSALLRMASTSRSTIIAATGHQDGSGSNFYHSVH